MKGLISKFKKNKVKNSLYLIIFLFGIIFLNFNQADAQWEVPSNLPPDSNIYTPLNVGPYKQAKSGGLLLDPLYNPYGELPKFDYPLEVRGTKDVYINNMNVLPEGNLIVDTDTLYVDGELHRVGIGTTSFEDTSTLEVQGGGVYIDQVTTGPGLDVSSSSTDEVVTGFSTSSDSSTIYGLGQGDTIGIYGLNVSSGTGIYARSNDSSAVVGSANSPYDTSGDIVAGIYGTARGLGSWAGYFEQRMFGNDEVVASKFVPNKLQSSEIPYTVGWTGDEVSASELVSLEYIAFDGHYIWAARNGDWTSYYPETVMVIDPDNMEIKEKFILGDEIGMGAHNIKEMIYGGGYVWLAHNTCNGGGCEQKSTVTRFDVNNYSSVEAYIINDFGNDNDYYTVAQELLYDDQTSGGPYVWVVSEIRSDVNDTGSLDTYSIHQMQIDGTPVRTFTLNPAGGTKCEAFNTNQCSDELDNDTDGQIDNGLCVELPIPSDQASCESASGWAWTDGVCQDKEYITEVDCITNCGANCWAPSTCSKISCDQAQCGVCTGGTWDGTDCDDVACTTEATCNGGCPSDWIPSEDQCVERGCGSTWDGTDCDDARCSNQTSCEAEPIGNAGNDEEVYKSSIGIPSGITSDGTYIWLSFQAAQSSSIYPDRYAADGYAKFKADDPENTSEQYIYCSGAATSPTSIVYDYVNDKIWMPYAYRPTPFTRGLVDINVNSGVVDTLYPQLFGTPWNTEQGIKFYGNSPGGPSLWVGRADGLYKIDPSNPSPIQHFYYHTTTDMDFVDFAFDTRDPNNPFVWLATAQDGVLVKNTMDDPPGYSTTTNIIKGATVDDMVTDGNYIWANSSGSTIITKYSAKDRSKVAEYDIGFYPGLFVFDGKGIWIPYEESFNTYYKRIDAVTGDIEDYRVLPDVGYTYYSTDITFDGQNIWQTINSQDRIIKVDLTDCDSATLQCKTAFSYDTEEGPRQPLFDGQNIWLTHDDNRISKISTDGITEAVLTIPEIAGDRIRTMEFDGTYLWFGTYDVDADGNSVFKINPRGIDNIGTDATDEVGVCSDDVNIMCNFNADNGCTGTCDAVIDGKYPIYHKINEGVADVRAMAFDGIFMWVAHRAYNHNAETQGVGVCDDNIDNDGNGLCDYDGAIGYPGCSGRPDPGCSSAGDSYENYDNEIYISRINVATGEIVESIPVTNGDHSYEINDMIFDGQHIWIGGTDINHNTLAQFYSGTGFNSTDYINSLILRDNIPLQSSFEQSGSISVRGSAAIGGKLIVDGDLIVQNNKWGGTADNLVGYGDGCSDGEFVKGVSLDSVPNPQLQCRPL